MDLPPRDPRRQREARHVAPDELGPLGVSEGLTEHVAQVRHRPGRQTSGSLRIQEGLHVGGTEIDDGMLPEAGDEVEADHAAIADERLGPDGEAHDVAQPVLEVYPEQDRGGRRLSRSRRDRSPSGERGWADHRRARHGFRVCMSAF